MLLVCGCREQIVHNLNEPDVNKLLSALNEIQIEAQKIKQPDGQWSLAVDDADMVRAISYLSETKRLGTTRESLVQKPSMMSSREDQHFHYERALSREIEHTLMAIAGVLEARVHLNLPAVDPLFGKALNNQVGSASVLLIVEKNNPIPREQIAQLVAGAGGIAEKSVAILFSEVESSDQKIILASKNSNQAQVPSEQRSDLKLPGWSISKLLSNSKSSLVLAAVLSLLMGAWLLFSALRRSRV